MSNRQCYWLAGALLLVPLLMIQDSSAGDVTYTAWEDDEENVWVRLVNGRASKIRIEEFVIVFYDAKGRPTDQRDYPCSGNCSILQNDARDFMLERKPKGAETYHIRNVRFKDES